MLGISIEDDDIKNVNADGEGIESIENETEDLNNEMGIINLFKDWSQTCFDKKPMCTIGKWTDHLTFEVKLTVLLVIPSGVTTGEIEVSAIDEGKDKFL